MTTLSTTTFYQQRGFTLIEALVAFLILSIGMLGIASLQTVALKAGSTATLRSAAVQENQEILERMRANPDGLSFRDPTNLGKTNYAGTFDISTAKPTSCSDVGGSIVSCAPPQMALYDTYEWIQNILGAFPANTKATIAVTDTPSGTPHTVTVTIIWPERSTATSGATTTQKFTTQQLICDLSCPH